MKAIGYIRVSTFSQVEDGVSMDAQEAKIHAWADLNNADEVIIFRDEGISGKRADNRPGLQDALATVSKGDALIVYSLSRLSRSLLDTVAMSGELDRKGIDLVSITDKIDTTSANGKLYFHIMAAFNQHYRDIISDQTKAALQYKKTKGEKTGGYLPFGYRLKGRQLVANPNEQKALSLIRDLRLKGYALRAICDELAKEGYKTRRGNLKWHPQVVNQIITNMDKKAA